MNLHTHINTKRAREKQARKMKKYYLEGFRFHFHRHHHHHHYCGLFVIIEKKREEEKTAIQRNKHTHTQHELFSIKIKFILDNNNLKYKT